METPSTTPAVSLPATPLVPVRAALVVGHPGHELRVYRWLELHRPLVFVLTDGSGGRGEARIESTATLLNATGARRGSVFGRVSDRRVYEAVLAGDTGFFTSLAEELAEALRAEQIELVVGDAVEGYNPTHDLCRLVVDAAVRLASRGADRPLANYDFVLAATPGECPDELRERALWLRLGEAELERKLAAARAYPEMRAEVEAAMQRFGLGAFATECLRPVEAGPRPAHGDTPFYEQYGEKQVAAGVYQQVLRYREHVLPVAEALARLD
jgi:hypothetical protein